MVDAAYNLNNVGTGFFIELFLGHTKNYSLTNYSVQINVITQSTLTPSEYYVNLNGLNLTCTGLAFLNPTLVNADCFYMNPEFGANQTISYLISLANLSEAMDPINPYPGNYIPYPYSTR